MDNKIQIVKDWLGKGSINLFGRPFSGKDTQGARLAESLRAPLIGGGDILRHTKKSSDLDKVISSGGLIPSDKYFDLILPYLSKNEFKGKPLVLDAVGRSKGEERNVLHAASKSGHEIKAVILLTLSEQEVWKRFDAAKTEHDRDGRSDDKKETLKNRLEKFKIKTLPVLDFYREKGLLLQVNGSGTRDEVFDDMINSLYEFSRH